MTLENISFFQVSSGYCGKNTFFTEVSAVRQLFVARQCCAELNGPSKTCDRSLLWTLCLRRRVVLAREAGAFQKQVEFWTIFGRN